MLNIYPNEGNFVLPSFMFPVVPPDADPDAEPLHTATFSAAWLPFLMGAMDQLLLYASWDADNDAKLLASMRAATLKEIIATDALRTVPTPYWDEDSEVDDEELTEMQPWYGSVTDPEVDPDELDFVENAAIWIFTGFLAVATIELAAAPAILFHTIAPRFVLAVRRGEFAEIIRILVDGQDAVAVDTSGYTDGDVIEVPIIADPSVMGGHDVMLVQVT